MIENGDKCPACQQLAMPKVAPQSLAKARACAACGYVQEIGDAE